MVNMDDTKYRQKIGQRVSQKSKLLLSNPKFHKDVVELRKAWKIPPDGLKTNEESEKWHHQHYDDSDRYYDEVWVANRPKFEALRQEKKFLEVEKLKKDLNDANPVNALRKSIKNLLVKYKLSPRWENPVKMYLLSNQLQGMGMFLGVVTRLEFDEDNGLEKLCIEISEDTTLADIKHAWPWIKGQQNRLSYKTQKKIQPIKNLDRDKRIHELAEQGLEYKKIAEKISEEFQVPDGFSYEDVSKILNRYRKRIGQQ